jgi:hypothetical protein
MKSTQDNIDRALGIPVDHGHQNDRKTPLFMKVRVWIAVIVLVIAAIWLLENLLT